MTSDGRDLVEQFYQLMSVVPDTDAVAEMYASDALIIRFDGTCTGLEEIATFLAGVHLRHRPYELHSVDQLAKVGDVVMWDAVVDTAKGLLETTEVFVLNDEGQIERHIPGVRGYWGS